MSDRDHRPMDAVESGPVPSTAMTSPEHAAPGPRAASASTAPAAATARCRAAPCAAGCPAGRRATVAGPAAAAAADDHLADPADHPAGARRPRPAGLRARPDPGPPGQREHGSAPARVRRLLYRVPAAGSALGDAPARDGAPDRGHDSTEILFLSWTVNCLVPAKLGDVYRAFLLKINTPTSSLSRTFGTVFIERVLDVFAIVVLGLAAGFWSFRGGLPPGVQVVFGIGVVVVVVLAVGLLTLRNFGRRIIVRLPLPHRILELYDRFEEGVFGAVGVKHLPKLAALTALIWATEGLRLFLVARALVPDNHMGLSGAFFVALIGSLLTAVPLSPAGLGIVEAGLVGVLTIAYGIPRHGGGRDRARGPHDQRALDHRPRLDGVCGLAEAQRRGTPRRADRPREPGSGCLRGGAAAPQSRRSAAHRGDACQTADTRLQRSLRGGVARIRAPSTGVPLGVGPATRTGHAWTATHPTPLAAAGRVHAPSASTNG